MHVTIIPIMMRNKSSKSNVEAEGRELVYQTILLSIATLGTYQSVRTFILPTA